MRRGEKEGGWGEGGGEEGGVGRVGGGWEKEWVRRGEKEG